VKRKVAAATAGMAVWGGLMFAPAPAEATPTSEMVADSFYATCTVLRNNLNGDDVNDLGTIVGIAKAISTHYSVPIEQAAEVEVLQVYNYCPTFFPRVVQLSKTASRSTYV